MSKIYYCYLTDIGKITIAEDEGVIVRVALGELEYDICARTPATDKAYTQICEYLEGKRKKFDIKFRAEGTDFQKKVWEALCDIPYGQTRSYGEIAARIGVKGGGRAVGTANRKNPVLMLIPCHRVIGADGTLRGEGKGAKMRRALIDLEKKNIK